MDEIKRASIYNNILESYLLSIYLFILIRYVLTPTYIEEYVNNYLMRLRSKYAICARNKKSSAYSECIPLK